MRSAGRENQEVHSSRSVRAPNARGSSTSINKPFLRQMLNHNDDFGKPLRHRRAIKRRSVNFNTRVGHHMQRDLLMRKHNLLPSHERSLLFMLLACLQLVAHPVGRATLMIAFTYKVDAHRFGMTLQLDRDLIGRLACPALDHQLGMNPPIGWRMMARGQFAYLALLLFILRPSCLYALGHCPAPSSGTFSSHRVSPLRNGALGVPAPSFLPDFSALSIRAYWYCAIRDWISRSSARVA